MIHFLISHSISLYCQTGREETEGRDKDTGERKDSREEETDGRE